ncbi:hypothetical protein [Aestuariivirga sp.]|uniref:hypothetical protein n=1 Tax=Aestuariivirga sp. TaxID=2650926 RepID=UPI0039E589F6
MLYNAIPLSHWVNGFGSLFIIEDRDLYLSEIQLTDSSNIINGAWHFPEIPSAQLVVPIPPNPAEIPAGGCSEWESMEDYELRLALVFQETGAVNLPRRCTNRVLIQLTGANFGTNVIETD